MKTLTRIETRKVKHYFTPEEKAEFSAEAMQLKNDIEAKKKEASSVAATYKAEVGTMDAKEKLLRTKYTEGFENREEYVFVKKDYEARKVYYISRESGTILDVENFTPRDEVKQLDINAEELKTSATEPTFVEKAEKFFYGLLVEMEDNKDDSVSRETVNLDKWRFISLFVNYCEKNSLLEISSPVSFDEAFDTVQPIFESWLEKTYPTGVQEETVEAPETSLEPVSVVVSYAGRSARFEDLEPLTTLSELKEFTAEFFGMSNEEVEGFGFMQTVVAEGEGVGFAWINILDSVSSLPKNSVSDAVELIFSFDCPKEFLNIEEATPESEAPTVEEEADAKIKPLLDGLPQADFSQLPQDFKVWGTILPPTEEEQQDILKSALDSEKPEKPKKEKVEKPKEEKKPKAKKADSEPGKEESN